MMSYSAMASPYSARADLHARAISAAIVAQETTARCFEMALNGSKLPYGGWSVQPVRVPVFDPKLLSAEMMCGPSLPRSQAPENRIHHSAVSSYDQPPALYPKLSIIRALSGMPIRLIEGLRECERVTGDAVQKWMSSVAAILH